MGLFSRIGSFFTRDVEKASTPPGTDDVIAYSGWLQNRERNPKLIGRQKWRTYDNAANATIVATGIRYSADLIGGTKWTAQPNPAGGRDADRGVEIIEQGLFNAPMPSPWGSCTKKQSMYRVFGSALHAWSTRTRSDGMVVFANLAHRPMHTVERWDIPSGQPWRGIWQRSTNGEVFPVARNKLWHAWDNTLTDQPDGIGLLRHVIDLIDDLAHFREIEGSAYQSDLAGIPVGYYPASEYKSEETRTAGKKSIEDFLENRVRDARKLQYLLFDSAIYKGADPNVISQRLKWFVEILKSDTTNLPNIDVVIRRVQMEIARLFGIEHVLMGDGEGSRAVHEDKTGQLAVRLASTNREMAAFAQNDLARVLVALNGLDPETATPTLIPAPIAMDSIVNLTLALRNMAGAGMRPASPQRNAVLERMELPPEEPGEEDMFDPRLGTPIQPTPAQGASLAPDEVDVSVNDLGDTSGDAPTNASSSGKAPAVAAQPTDAQPKKPKAKR